MVQGVGSCDMNADFFPQTIGALARASGVGVTTLRYYERAGLLPKPARSDSNYRLYPAATAARIRFIRRAQQLGFTLAEINELLGLRVSARATCADVRTRAEAKVADIEARIRSLRRMSRALAKLAEECGQPHPACACPLLDRLGAGF